jgi:hypothetical protein
MNNEWIYRVGIALKEINDISGIELSEKELENLLDKSDMKYTRISVEEALLEHIDETLNKPYKFDTSMRVDAPNAFSCSSLISYLYVYAGIWMPSVVIDKFFYFEPIDKKDLRFGDVVFSYNPDAMPSRKTSVEYMPGQLSTEKLVNHMGMYLGEGKILQASGYWYKGKVLIENLDESPSFKKISGYGRVVKDLSERRFVIEISKDRPELRIKENLIKEITKLWQL